MKYRIIGVPVFIGGHLFSRPEDIGREIIAPEGMDGSKLAAVEPAPPVPPPAPEPDPEPEAAKDEAPEADPAPEPAPPVPKRRSRNA